MSQQSFKPSQSESIKFSWGDNVNAIDATNAPDLVIESATESGVITGWYIQGNEVGDCVVDVLIGTRGAEVSITGSEKPSLVSSSQNSDTAITTWTAPIAKGDRMVVRLDSSGTLKFISGQINYN